MYLASEQYQLHDSYFFVIDPFMCGIIGVLVVVIILFFVWKRIKKKTIN